MAALLHSSLIPIDVESCHVTKVSALPRLNGLGKRRVDALKHIMFQDDIQVRTHVLKN
jgi:hypothetical protein